MIVPTSRNENVHHTQLPANKLLGFCQIGTGIYFIAWDLHGDVYDEIVFLHAATRERAREVKEKMEALEAEVDLAEKRHYVMTVGGRCIRQQAKKAHTDLHIKEAALVAAKVALESLIVARISAGERIMALESTPEPHIGASELVKTNGRKRRHTNHRD